MTNPILTTQQPTNLFAQTSFTPIDSIKAVFWDVDGTLVNSEPLFEHAVKVFCKNHNYDLSPEFIAKWAGTTLEATFNLIVLDFEATHLNFIDFKNEIMAYVIDNFEKAAHMFETLPDTLAMIQNRDIRQAVVSNGQRAIVSKSVQSVGEHFFEFSLAIEDTVDGKPSPTPYLMAAEKMGIPPQNCLVIEDSAAGLTSGLKAGMNVIASPSNHSYFMNNLETFQKAHLLIDRLERVDWDIVLR